MSRFEKVKNVSIYSDLTQSAGQWFQTPDLRFSPDEVVVRQITYNGPPTSDGAFLLWSNLNNDFIGSFSVSEATGFTSCCVNVKPDTTIICQPNSVPHSLQFQIYSINGESKPVYSTNLLGSLIINLDFIKYR